MAITQARPVIGPRIHPRIAVNMVSSIGWTLEEDLAFYKSRGINAITILSDKVSADYVAGARAIRAAALRVAAVSGAAQISRDKLSLIEDAAATEALFAPLLALAEELESPCVYFIAGSADPRLSSDAAFERLIEALRPLVASARARGLTLAIEPNSPASRDTGFVHTVADALDLARETGVALCVEVQNCWYERNLLRSFREEIDRIAIVQVSDFLLGETFKLNRRVPGDGSIPLEWLLGGLLDAGYTGDFDLELIGPAIDREGYASAIDRGVEWLSSRLTRWGA